MPRFALFSGKFTSPLYAPAAPIRPSRLPDAGKISEKPRRTYGNAL